MISASEYSRQTIGSVLPPWPRYLPETAGATTPAQKIAHGAKSFDTRRIRPVPTGALPLRSAIPAESLDTSVAGRAATEFQQVLSFQMFASPMSSLAAALDLTRAPSTGEEVPRERTQTCKDRKGNRRRSKPTQTNQTPIDERNESHEDYHRTARRPLRPRRPPPALPAAAAPAKEAGNGTKVNINTADAAQLAAAAAGGPVRGAAHRRATASRTARSRPPRT